MEAGVGGEHELAAATLTLAGGYVASLGHGVRFGPGGWGVSPHEIFHHGWISFVLPSEPTRNVLVSRCRYPDCTAPDLDRAPGRIGNRGCRVSPGGIVSYRRTP